MAYFPVWAQCVFTFALFLLLVSAVIFSGNYTAAKAAHARVASDKALLELVKAAKENNQKYAIESAVMIVQPDAAYYDPRASEAAIDVRMIYTISAREDMNAKDFTEAFHSKYGTVAWLAGSQTERRKDEATGMKEW